VDIPGLDVALAIARMSGLKSLYVRTARDFSKTLGSLVANLRPLMEQGADQQARMLLHTLKGNAGTLGATTLAQEAARLEALCTAAGAHGMARTQLDTLEILAQSTAQALRQAIEALDPVAGHSAASLVSLSTKNVFLKKSDPQVIAALTELAGLMRQSDLAVLQRFAELRVTLQTLPQDSIDALEEALQNLDLDAALAQCLECIRNV
jgi:HPt (histidine-containing phosphotransfer) domain-containing protein